MNRATPPAGPAIGADEPSEQSLLLSAAMASGRCVGIVLRGAPRTDATMVVGRLVSYRVAAHEIVVATRRTPETAGALERVTLALDTIAHVELLESGATH